MFYNNYGLFLHMDPGKNECRLFVNAIWNYVWSGREQLEWDEQFGSNYRS